MLRFNFSRFAALVGLAAVFSSCTKSVVVEEGGVKSHVTVDVRTFALDAEGFGFVYFSKYLGFGQEHFLLASFVHLAVVLFVLT